VHKLRIRMPDAAARSDLKRMLGLVSPHWRSLTSAGLMLVVSSLIGLVLPAVIRWLVDSVFVTHDLGQLTNVALGLLALSVLQNGLAVAYFYLVSKVGQRFIADVRLQIYERVQSLPLRFFAERRTGEIVSRISNDVTFVQQALTETPILFVRHLITLVGGLTLMLVMNWQLTLIVLGLIPPLMAIGLVFGRRLEQLSTAVQDRLADSTVALEEMLSGIRVVKSFAREAFERNRFALYVESAYATSMQRARIRALFVPLISLLGFAAMALMLWYGGRQVVLGMITPGELIAFLFYMILVAGPLGEFAGLYAQLRQAIGAGRRLFELLDSAPEPLAVPDAIMPGQLRGQVQFVKVSFAYDGGEHVLEDISIDVQPGKVIAIVGPSGVGKTTLVNLVPRFYDPTAGCIEIDGHDIREFDLHGLREKIGLVPQETFLFGGTIRENIAYGRLDASEDEIAAAAQAANAHQFIVGLPDGYGTIVGEKGVKLSMGQRQRITIARVLLKDPRILILDEATSSLDSESERLVQEALERLMSGRTTFVIAHRLSTIQRADRIVALQNGRIVEEGRHTDLLAQDGLYRHLWSLQFADREDAP